MPTSVHTAAMLGEQYIPGAAAFGVAVRGAALTVVAPLDLAGAAVGDAIAGVAAVGHVKCFTVQSTPTTWQSTCAAGEQKNRGVAGDAVAAGEAIAVVMPNGGQCTCGIEHTRLITWHTTWTAGEQKNLVLAAAVDAWSIAVSPIGGHNLVLGHGML